MFLNTLPRAFEDFDFPIECEIQGTIVVFVEQAADESRGLEKTWYTVHDLSGECVWNH